MDLLSKLPGELRNTIYEHIAKDDYLLLRPETHDKGFSMTLHCALPMHSVPEQIRAEYVRLVARSALAIRTKVYNDDVSHIDAFLGSLSEDGSGGLQNIGSRPTRRFIINTKFTDAGQFQSRAQALKDLLFPARCRKLYNKSFELVLEPNIPRSFFHYLKGDVISSLFGLTLLDLSIHLVPKLLRLLQYLIDGSKR